MIKTLVTEELNFNFLTKIKIFIICTNYKFNEKHTF